jgi:hypothetical protein
VFESVSDVNGIIDLEDIDKLNIDVDRLHTCTYVRVKVID